MARSYGNKPHRIANGFWMARLDTHKFSFEAYGTSEDMAVQALHSGLRDHARQYDIPLDWFEEGFEHTLTRFVCCGECYRDNEKIPVLA
jgi:hypothetical protein